MTEPHHKPSTVSRLLARWTISAHRYTNKLPERSGVGYEEVNLRTGWQQKGPWSAKPQKETDYFSKSRSQFRDGTGL